MSNNKCILDISPLYNAIVVNRPSKVNKSPYLADIKINGKIVMAHTPALGLSGLIIPGTKIKVKAKCEDKTGKRCSNYSIEKVWVGKTWVGSNPVIANTIFRNTINKKLFPPLKKLTITQSEVTILDSRIDFQGIDNKGIDNKGIDNKGIDNNGNKVYIEVKNVPLSDFHISEAPTDRKIFYSTQDKKKYEKVAVFPDGQIKSGEKFVSPRAYKHLLTLEKLSKRKNVRSILVYIIPRSDCKKFIINYVKDPIYAKKVYNILQNKSVEIYAISYQWRGDKLYYQKELPIIFPANKLGNYYHYGKVKSKSG